MTDANETRTVPFAAVAERVGAFLLVYDPYHPEIVRDRIAKYDATRLIDSPRAQIVVLIPLLRQHLESGNRVDFDVLRHGVDVVGVYDPDSARKVGKALVGSGVRVIVLPSPRSRDLTEFQQLDHRQQLPGKAAVVQALYNVTTAEARSIASQVGPPVKPAPSKYAREQREE